MRPILICLLVIILIKCAKEYSCENCYEKTIIPSRTIPNELITSCSIFIENESDLKWIYPEVITKYHPATWWIFDSIRMDKSHQYNRTYDLKKYLQMDKFTIGDTFFVRYEIRWRFKNEDYVCDTVLVY
jgi:hypothetical protein